MTKSRNIRTTLEQLLKKVEQLENQGFAQKLAIDELENKLQQAEDTIKIIKDNPFGFTSTSYTGLPIVTPVVMPQQLHNVHVCQTGYPDYLGNTYCVTCGSYMSGVTYTSGTYSMGSYTLPIAQQLSPDVESISEDIDISSLLPDDSSKQE